MRAIVIAVALVSSAMAWAADKGQPLNVKTGLWETTMTTTTNGQMPIPPEYLAKMSPEQRARYEEKMKANSGEKTNTRTTKNCVTKEELDRGIVFGQDQKDCTETIVTSTSSKREMRVTCDKASMKSTGTVSFEVLNPETVKGSTHMSMTAGDHTMKIDNAVTSKWMGSDCGNVK